MNKKDLTRLHEAGFITRDEYIGQIAKEIKEERALGLKPIIYKPQINQKPITSIAPERSYDD
jgi:hypothetical protein